MQYFLIQDSAYIRFNIKDNEAFTFESWQLNQLLGIFFLESKDGFANAIGDEGSTLGIRMDSVLPEEFRMSFRGAVNINKRKVFVLGQLADKLRNEVHDFCIYSVGIGCIEAFGKYSGRCHKKDLGTAFQGKIMRKHFSVVFGKGLSVFPVTGF